MNYNYRQLTVKKSHKHNGEQEKPDIKEFVYVKFKTRPNSPGQVRSQMNDYS